MRNYSRRDALKMGVGSIAAMTMPATFFPKDEEKKHYHYTKL